MKKYLLLAFLFCSTGTLSAQATRDTFALKQLVVSVTRLPLERAAASAAVSVIDAAELRSHGIRTVADALKLVAGTTLTQSGSYGAFGSLFMRGGQSDYVQVLVDGIRVNSPGEHFDFGNFTIEDIDRIEVVRGPASVLYGSDAVSGVVQIFTKRGGQGTHLAVTAAGGVGNRVGATASGNYGSGNIDAQLQGGSARSGFSVGLTRFESGGAYAYNNQNSNTGVTTRLDYKPDTATAIATTVRYTSNTFHYPTDGAGNIVDANQRDVTSGIAAGIDAGRKLGSRLDARALFSFDRNSDRYSDAQDNAGDTLGFYAYFSKERFQHEAADLRLNYSPAARTVVTLGGEYDRQHENGSNLSESQYGPSDGNSRESRDNKAAYAQLLGTLSALNYQLGLRFDHNNRFGDFTTWRAGASLRLTHDLHARASAGTAFKQPRFYEQFATGYVKGNPDLTPERTRSFDVGAEYDRSGWRAGATWFAQHFRDLIQYVGTPAHAGDPNYLNLGAANANGLELEAERYFGRLSATASYTLLQTRVTDAGTGDDPLFVAGSKLVRRPEHSGSVSLLYSAAGWNAGVVTTYTGRRDDLDYRNYPSVRVILPAYARIDLSAEKELSARGLRATVKLENALNAAYQDAFNFPSRGRVVFVGFRYAN